MIKHIRFCIHMLSCYTRRERGPRSRSWHISLVRIQFVDFLLKWSRWYRVLLQSWLFNFWCVFYRCVFLWLNNNFRWCSERQWRFINFIKKLILVYKRSRWLLCLQGNYFIRRSWSKCYCYSGHLSIESYFCCVFSFYFWLKYTQTFCVKCWFLLGEVFGGLRSHCLNFPLS